MTDPIIEKGDAAWLRRHNAAVAGRDHGTILEFEDVLGITVAHTRVDELCHPHAPIKLKAEIQHRLEVSPERSLVLDLASVQRVTSATIGTLVWANHVLRARHGRLVLSGVHWQVNEILALCGLDKQIAAFPRVVEAVAALSK